MNDVNSQIDKATDSFKDVEAFNRVQKAIEFKDAYRARTGHRPSLVSVIALWQKAEADKVVLAEVVSHFQAKADDLQAKLDARTE
jgi:hypothetical protein